MKRRRRGGAAQPVGACDVWLDMARLKQRAAQSLVAKPKASSRVLERKHTSVAFTQMSTSQPCTKQTTISAFFRARTAYPELRMSSLILRSYIRFYIKWFQKQMWDLMPSSDEDEKDKENARPSPFIPDKDCKEKGVSLAVKILALPQMEEAHKELFRVEVGTVQGTPQRHAQKAAASLSPLPNSSVSQEESHSKSEASCGVGEDCCFFSFTQDSEGNRIIAHRNVSDLFAGETVSAHGRVTSERGTNEREGQPLPEEAQTGLDFQPRLGANQSKKPHQSSSVHSLFDFSETENINPTVTRDSTGAVGFYSSPQRPAGAQPLRERSLNAGAGSAEEGWGSKRGLSSPCRQLFTQDSEGNRVIAHCGQNLPSPRKDSGSACRQLPTSPYQGWSSHAANRSLSNLGEQQLDVCYDLLFTQDSEGNRVIKHW